MNKIDNREASGNRLEETWERLQREGRKALIPFFMSGDPDLKSTREHVLQAVEAGADIIELGIPSSDALADGPTVQEAALRALKTGTNPEKVLRLVAILRRETEVPVVLLGYYNQILQWGENCFLKEIKKNGGDGLIVPDLPLEESVCLRIEAERCGLSFIAMATPLAEQERNRRVAEAGSGFLYCVSVSGVTGVRHSISGEAVAMLQALRGLTSLPLALGFGISNPKQAAEAGCYADGVIVGSALIKGLENRERKERLSYIENSLLPMRRSLDGETGSKRE